MLRRLGRVGYIWLLTSVGWSTRSTFSKTQGTCFPFLLLLFPPLFYLGIPCLEKKRRRSLSSQRLFPPLPLSAPFPPNPSAPHAPTAPGMPRGPARTTAPSSPRAGARPTSGGAGRARARDGDGGGGAAVSAGRALPPLSPLSPGLFPALSSAPGSPGCALGLGARPGAGFGAWGGAPGCSWGSRALGWGPRAAAVGVEQRRAPLNPGPSPVLQMQAELRG